MKSKPYDIYLKEFGNNLRRIRKDKGFTMESVANEAEIEYRQLGRIERGEVNTTIISLLRISEVLKIDMKVLFEFSISEQQAE
ncbi:MAG: helix-turn-helix transcriptional regulator [Bacteroidia bacterium]|nr:helix-turn-helix transcriptional regulator [Bacteroidia bacterium]